MNPIKHSLILRLMITDSFRRRNGGCEIFHEGGVDLQDVALRIVRVSNFIRFARFSKNFLGTVNVACVEKTAAV
jgi:hypothetical protein